MRKTLIFMALMECTLGYGQSFNARVLPSNFIIYTNGTSGSLNQVDGSFKKTILPTTQHRPSGHASGNFFSHNDYTQNPGCYVACYTQNPDKAIYSVANGIYIIGQIRVAGIYVQRNCVPLGMARQDLSQNAAFKTLCEKKFPEACPEGRCWAGGETGGWLGIIPR